MKKGHRQDWHYAIVAALIKTPLTIADAAAATGCSLETASRVLKNLRTHGAAHIYAYRRGGAYGIQRAVYRIGEGVEAEEPEAKSRSQRCKEWRAKQKPAPTYGYWGI
jgi:DNA-binding IclR family transcriptional regulator